MNICFLVELPYGFWQWDDGLRGAMRILEKSHTVTYHLDGVCNCPTLPDVVFAWGGTMSKTYKNALKMETKRLLLFAGGPRNPELFEGFNMTCFENDLHTLQARPQGVKCMTAFGTDTTVFKPMNQPKVFDVIYPGAFGLWKRKALFAQAVKGMKALTLGNIQEHERKECFDVCVENNIAVSADIPQSRLPYFMAMARVVVVLPAPEIGCQRTVLEAQAMKLPVIVPSDAPLVVEFAQHGGTIVDPEPEKIRQAIRNAPQVNSAGYEYVLNNMTEVHYAKKLEIALNRCFTLS